MMVEQRTQVSINSRALKEPSWMEFIIVYTDHDFTVFILKVIICKMGLTGDAVLGMMGVVKDHN